MRKTLLSLLLAVAAATGIQAQNITVNGVVLSKADQEPLIGATVRALGSETGTSTDFDGNFTLSVEQGAILQFSYVGYRQVELPAEPNMTVYMDENSEILDEVVVIGYQTVRKADLTGAVSVMNMKEPLSENSGNIMSSMAGKLAGVNVIPDAAPGGTGSIRVRGMSTANSSNDPLYIIDGVPTDNLNMINPADIETMQVLKDAASASLYGSRAANGVVVITTKHGKGDRLAININYAATVQTIAKRYKVMDAQQWGQAYWMAAANSGMPIGDDVARMYGNGPTPQLQSSIGGNTNFPTANTDWQDQVYQTAWTNNLTATISNSGEKGSVLFSLNLIDQNSNIKTAFYERYSARINSEYRFNKYISVGENLAVARWQNRGVDVAGDRGIPSLALVQHPALPVYGLNGDWTNPMKLISSDFANPLQVIDYAKNNSSTSWRILGNAYLQVNPIPELAIKTNLGIEHSQYFNKSLGISTNPSEENPGLQNSVSAGYGEGDTWTWTNTANYSKVFAEKHHLTVLLGTEAIKYVFNDVSAYRNGYNITTPDFMQINAGTGDRSNGGERRSWSVFSLFGKVDYNFMDRYLVSFTIRRDANSRFDKKHRSGVFPAFSLAWRPTEEGFFPRNEVLTDLKVRYSWGQNGNANIPPLYPAYTTYGYNSVNGSYDLSGTNSASSAGIIVASTGNPDLKWETTTQNNIGLDLQFLNGALNVTADFFIKNTKDMLTWIDALAVAGENAGTWQNTGEMRNIGWEFTAGYFSPQYGDFSWNASLNLSQYKNKLIRLNNQKEFVGGDSRLMPGQPMGVYYGYVCDGIFQNAEQVANHAAQTGAAPGRLIYRDLNGDGVINDEDRCIIGDPNPDLAVGLNLGAKWKNWSLDMFFSGEFGFDIINHTKAQLYNMSSSTNLWNRSVDVLNAWTPENPGSDIPALQLVDNNNEQRFSTYYTQNGSYMKMKYLKLAYTFPEQWIKKFAQSIDLYFQVENVFTMTKYKGLDPEILPGEYGIRLDSGAYPRPRSFTLGLNVVF